MNVLAFFAHPDDETMLAGGTLALLAELGATVYYVCTTRDEGGETGELPGRPSGGRVASGKKHRYFTPGRMRPT